MTQRSPSDLIQAIWEYPLFAALYGRRSRRFGLGLNLTEGPFQYKSQGKTLPLSELEEALLVAAGVGVTGAPLWDASRPPASPPGGDGRTFPTTTRGRRTALFLTNDDGVYVIDPRNIAATKLREVETPDEREKILAVHREHRKELRRGRLEIPRQVPPLFAHNLWNSNAPGSTLFMPICDVSLSLIAMTSQLVDADGGRFVGKHGGGMYVVDDRHDFRPAGTEKWVNNGFLDRNKVLPLSLLERHACYFMFSEPAAICQNIFLATEALGVGGWMHCGFLSLGVLEALGFRTVNSSSSPALANPVGLDGVFEGYCPPYHVNMDAAVDAVVARMSRKSADAAAPAQPAGPAPYLMSHDDYRRNLVEISDEGVACTKAICNYIYDTYGRFPGTVDTMHLMWFMQAHHLDLDYYDRFFHAGAYGPTHAAHMATWHS
jgi:hypothetical protein